MSRVLVLGIDGATWDLLEPWAKSGLLPNLQKAMECGVYGHLESSIPHVTPPAWTSMTTGKNPGKHGIYDFVRIKREKKILNLGLYNSKDKQEKELWDYITGPSIVVNVPLTYPPRKINGVMITGMYTPDMDSNFTYPKQVKDEILQLFPNYKIELKWGKYKEEKHRFLEDLNKMTQERINLFWHFFQMDWQLFFFVFVGSDRIQHIMWEENHLLNYYQYLDGFLGEVLKKVKNNNITLFLVSDHGFTEIKKYVYINTMLQRAGLLSPYKNKKANKNPLRGSKINKENLSRALIKLKLGDLYAKLPPKIKLFIGRKISDDFGSIYNIDFENSQAVMVGSGSIYITVQNEKQKEKIRKDVIELMENLKNPHTGEKIINKVYTKEELYSGNMLRHAPDIIILPSKGYSLYHTLSKKITENPQLKKADHALNGIFLAKGPEIKEGDRVDANIFDIAPTILHILGLPIPIDMDGQVLKGIFSKDSKVSTEPDYDKNYQEHKKLQEHIRNLKKRGKIYGMV